ncbi:CIA30 family protein [Antarctobacter jejuensis]|uniref:CIA30 family protein n=1 Tax=Antarctobacter jejuensis TaxID=1439938 RepID=UPI003FD02D9C
MSEQGHSMPAAMEIIDDLRFDPPLAVTGNGWALISDRVMGGVSSGEMRRETVNGREAIRMTGGVSLENDGGFLQVALDLGDAGDAVDASDWDGIRLDVLGNDQIYNLHLRTSDIRRPWESYRQSFHAPSEWTTVFLPFSEFEPHRTERSFKPSRLRRLGIVAIGREFEADIAVADIRFYAASDDAEDGAASSD